MLFDTHTLLWWWAYPEKLSDTAYSAIYEANTPLFVSVVNIWEIAIKHQKGKLHGVASIINHFDTLAKADEFLILPIYWHHARLAGQLPQAHKDPFDRMLAAQAISQQLTLISYDKALYQFDCKVLW